MQRAGDRHLGWTATTVDCKMQNQNALWAEIIHKQKTENRKSRKQQGFILGGGGGVDLPAENRICQLLPNGVASYSPTLLPFAIADEGSKSSKLPATMHATVSVTYHRVEIGKDPR